MDPWIKKRVGYISASHLADLMSPGRGSSALWGKTAIAYLYRVEMERHTGMPSVPRDAPAMRFGRENEKYAVDWLRENVDPDIRYYEEDFDEKPFITVPWARFGATPDTDLPDENGNPKTIFEIKCTYSDGEIYANFSPTKSYDSKKALVLQEHGDQIAGQFLACPTVDTIFILKYNPQRDECDWDTLSPLDPSRGILYEFTREQFGLRIDATKKRIIEADEYLNLGLELELINEYYR